VGKSSSDVSTILKGQPGTTLIIEVERPGIAKPITVNVTRKEIKLPNIPYFGMLTSDVGYIKLDQFTENAGNEVKEAFLKLKEQGMKYLVLDLRNNGGGLLHEAVNIMNIFVDPNIAIAETKGKIPEQKGQHKTRFPAIDKQIPVAVLVNSFSASASEIVSGAFQDLDRGVIIGKKTYGKGLVQNIIPLSYNTSLKITVSKYYIPSGRCVQNIDYFSHDTLPGVHYIPDSLAKPFKTKNGRTVYDKGGVEPDIVTPDSMMSNILMALIVHNHIFDFANQYRNKHESIAPAKEFKVDDALYNEFVNYIKEKEYSYTTDTEKLIEQLKEVATEEKHFTAIEQLYEQLKTQIAQDKKNDLQKFKSEISDFLASEIVSRYYFQKGRIINTLTSDPDIKEAITILKAPQRYNSILSPKK
ncbi:MAG: S41 family peptidase, partial [Bacteroidales bacterium]